jgi:molecular chaperone DnaK (HSP70)
VGGTTTLPKVSTILQGVFPAPTIILPITYNPSELVARGAAIQGSLISSYDVQTIAEAIHPVVTVVDHLTHPLGIKQHDNKLDVILEGDSALPCRGKRVYLSPEGGDVILQVFEGKRDTEIIPTPSTPTTEGEEGEDEEGEDDAPIKRRIIVPERGIAVVRVKGVQKGGKVEVQIQVDSEGRVVIVGREIGRKEGKITKGNVEPKQD